MMSRFIQSKHSKRNKNIDELFKYVGIVCTCIGLVLLAIFIFKILFMGIEKLNLDFLTSFTSRIARKAGIKTAWIGTLWVFGLTAIIALPIGIAAGVYLEEYGKKSKLANLLEINIANLAGVPSIIYGLLGLTIFVRVLGFGASILSGAATLALLIMPIIIVSTREAIRAVPDSIRQAAYGLGASKWQTIWTQVLPASVGGILTGAILALSRAIGETAPLIVVGAAAMVSFVPTTPMDEFTVLPMQIYDWATRPQEAFLINAAAAIVVLLCITFILNGIAVYFRNKWQKKISW